MRRRSGLGGRREDLVDDLDEDVAEFVAQGFAEGAEEVGRDGEVVVCLHGSWCVLIVGQFFFVLAKVGVFFGRMKCIWRIHCQIRLIHGSLTFPPKSPQFFTL